MLHFQSHPLLSKLKEQTKKPQHCALEILQGMMESDIGGTDRAKKETPLNSADPELEETDVKPWPYLRDHFGLKCRKGNRFITQCKLCLPRETELAAFKDFTSNLREHVEVS